MSVYPGSLDSFVAKVAHVDLYRAAHMNAVQGAIEAVEGELGTDPAGSAADLKTRLAVRIADDGKLKQPQQLVTVGKSNADYTTIQAAINSITDAAEAKPYTVLVAPGKYAEQVTAKDYVMIIGTDPLSTIICPDASSARGITVPDGVTTYIANLTSRPTGDETQGLHIAGTARVFHCDFYGTYSSIQMSGGTLTADFIRSYSEGFKIESKETTVEIRNSYFYRQYGPTVTLYYDSFIAYNCDFHGDNEALEFSGGSPEFYNCSIRPGKEAAKLYGDCSPKFSNCVLIASGTNKHALTLSNSGCTVTLTNCKIVKSGTAYAIYASQAATDVKVALCAMNTALHANCNNLIATPYNVIDAGID